MRPHFGPGWERGKTQPHLDSLIKLARVLRVSPGKLIDQLAGVESQEPEIYDLLIRLNALLLTLNAHQLRLATHLVAEIRAMK